MFDFFKRSFFRKLRIKLIFYKYIVVWKIYNLRIRLVIFNLFLIKFDFFGIDFGELVLESFFYFFLVELGIK